MRKKEGFLEYVTNRKKFYRMLLTQNLEVLVISAPALSRRGRLHSGAGSTLGAARPRQLRWPLRGNHGGETRWLHCLRRPLPGSPTAGSISVRESEKTVPNLGERQVNRALLIPLSQCVFGSVVIAQSLSGNVKRLDSIPVGVKFLSVSSWVTSKRWEISKTTVLRAGESRMMRSFSLSAPCL